jgi:hypothetical protein
MGEDKGEDVVNHRVNCHFKSDRKGLGESKISE